MLLYWVRAQEDTGHRGELDTVLPVRRSGSREAVSTTQARARWSKPQTRSPEGETAGLFWVRVRKELLAEVMAEPGLKGQVRESEVKRFERRVFAEGIVGVIGQRPNQLGVDGRAVARVGNVMHGVVLGVDLKRQG